MNKTLIIITFILIVPIEILAQLIIDNNQNTSSLSICNLQNDAVTYYMQNAYLDGDGAKYYNTDAENSLMNAIFQKYDDGKSKHEWTQWPQAVKFNTTGGNKIYISTDPTFNDIALSQNILSDITEVYNLVPNSIYYYKVVNNSNNILSSGKFATQGRIRMIKMDATYNVRDIGGHFCYDNQGNIIGITRYNLLYRGAMPKISDSEIAKKLNIKSQISICSVEEMKVLDPWNLNNKAFYGDNNYRLNDDEGFFVDYFTHINIAKVLKQIINNLSSNIILPTYYHCTAGADRTGGLTLILLGICGVSEDEILHDYELTSLTPFFIDDNYQRTGHRLLTDKERIGMMLNNLNEITNTGTLQEKIYYYLTTYLKNNKYTSLTNDEINTLRNLLIEPIPQIKDGFDQDIKLSITPFCITPGAEKGGVEGYLGISMKRGDAVGVTSLSCDIELPIGVTVTDDSPITIDKQSMPLCSDGGNVPHLYNVSTSISDSKQIVHLECSHRSGLCFEDNEQLTFHIKLKADNKLGNELSEIELKNIIVTGSDMSRLSLADNSASVIIGEPIFDSLELKGNYASNTINDFNTVLKNQKQLNTVDLRNIESVDATTVWQTGNPNTLFYLQSQTEIANTQNVVKNGVCENLVVTDLYSFNKLNEELVAENATYRRNTKTKWCTMCLPFAITSSDNLQLYTCQSIEDGTITLKKIESAEAGESIILANNTNQSTIQFLSNNVTITNQCFESTNNNETKMIGTFEEKKIDDQNIYYISNNEFWSNQSNTITIPAFRAWIVPSSATNMQSQLRASISEEDVTKLDRISENDLENIDCFNLMGQKISSNSNGMMLIKQNNGSVKKVFIQ